MLGSYVQAKRTASVEHSESNLARRIIEAVSELFHIMCLPLAPPPPTQAHTRQKSGTETETEKEMKMILKGGVA